MIYKYEQIYAKKGGSHDDKHIIAEIMASSIGEADELLKELCGVDVIKNPMVILTVTNKFSFDPYFVVDFEAGAAIL